MIANAIDKSDCDSLAPPAVTTISPPEDATDFAYSLGNITVPPDGDEGIDPVLACQLGIATAASLMAGIIQVAFV